MVSLGADLGRTRLSVVGGTLNAELRRSSPPRLTSITLPRATASVVSVALTVKPPAVVSYIFPDGSGAFPPAPPRDTAAATAAGSTDGPRPTLLGSELADAPLEGTDLVAAELALGAGAVPSTLEVPDAGRGPGGGSSAEKKNRRSDSPAAETRIKPPADCVKLEDRLYYLLQPSLERFSKSAALSFPFEPFPYQFEGIGFLYPRTAAILADEMGLGKTMQAISTIRMLLFAGEVRSILLICPKPLVTNWQREFALWAPEIVVTALEGDTSRRGFLWDQDASVKIANYESLMRDWPTQDEAGRQFDLVILDEAQRIKNRDSTTARTVCSIPRRRSWALTGTPVENHSTDLLGVFEFLAPGYLTTAMNARQLGQASRDYILRRTKDMVMSDMPPKLFRDEQILLTPEQRQTYQEAETGGVIRLNDLGDAITIQHVFELVLRLKQICNFDPVTGTSAKLDRLEAELEEVQASGQKAIVFSQWVKSLELLRPRLARFGALEYHGKIPTKRRDPILARFKEDPDCSVILMSYGTGAVGLNLQFCRYVFLFDRWWNPAIEDQAINRAHRIGAAGSVTVTRMVAAGTIEERIHQILEEKRELFATIFEDPSFASKTALTRDEIFGLFELPLPAPRRFAA